MEKQSKSNRVSRRAIAQVANKRMGDIVEDDQMVEILDTIFDVIAEQIIVGNEAAIYGFGKFGKRAYAARKARNPKTGESIDLTAFSTPYFRPSALLRKALK